MLARMFSLELERFYPRIPYALRTHRHYCEVHDHEWIHRGEGTACPIGWIEPCHET